MPKLLVALATMNPLWVGWVESVMVIPSPFVVSASATESWSPELKNETSELPTGLNVSKVASTGFGGPIGTPSWVMNAKLTYSSPVLAAHVELRTWPVTGFSDRLSMFSAAHHLVGSQLTPGGQSAQPGG